MAKYSFTCPLAGCALKMESGAQDHEAAAVDLVAQAEKHLQDVHPDVHKTHEEVDLDIRSHMVEE